MNKIHPKGAFGAEFEGQLFDLMMEGRPTQLAAKENNTKSMEKARAALAFKTESKAQLAEGFVRGRMPVQVGEIPHGRGKAQVIKKKTPAKRSKTAKTAKTAKATKVAKAGI